MLINQHFGILYNPEGILSRVEWYFMTTITHIKNEIVAIFTITITVECASKIFLL
jgi:hypothetical protein